MSNLSIFKTGNQFDYGLEGEEDPSEVLRKMREGHENSFPLDGDAARPGDGVLALWESNPEGPGMGTDCEHHQPRIAQGSQDDSWGAPAMPPGHGFPPRPMAMALYPRLTPNDNFGNPTFLPPPRAIRGGADVWTLRG